MIVGSKNKLLLKEEFSEYKLNPRTWHYIEKFSRHASHDKCEMNLLDWGCGRGRAVLWLRERGYQAFGVDIDSRIIQNGLDLFNERGYRDNTDKCLSMIDNEGKIGFPDSFFHFTYSDQVFEHVEDMELVAKELYRVMAPGSEGLHIYPAHKYFIEGHLFMPCVHWLPKNSLRKALIWTYVVLGREPRWRELEGQTFAQRTEVYYQYSRDRTYYRPYKQVSRIFQNCGFVVESKTIDHPNLHKNRLLSRIAYFRLSRPIVDYLINTFRSVELFIRKP